MKEKTKCLISVILMDIVFPLVCMVIGVIVGVELKKHGISL